MPFRQMTMDAVNRRAYSSRRALRAYARDGDLCLAERQILEKLRPSLTGRRLLDIGVGGGRTTGFLLSLSQDYVAIDYSEALVDATRRRFGVDSIYCCDAREMHLFSNESFDFVLFSFNGIDYVPHDGRLQALSEIRRVLRPGGLFLFSSHNRNWTAGPRKAGLDRASRAKRSIKRMLTAHRRWWLQQGETDTEQYAIVNDGGLRYSLLTYYIYPRCQIEQLKQCGFRVEGLYDSRGELTTDQDASPWLHYLGRKADDARGR